ncbi:MAG: 23S rRNA (adenine(2503)-C(2))-methyltransferase RlmN [Fimbriimonadales bacterium]|nr:23S rRNA (adenine(2503)-C(2))-methyltransferase RlmN [Fimbriimonadales bacterium]
MANGLPSLVGLTSAEIAQAALGGRDDARWRARQIAHWIYRKAKDSFEEMLDLPVGLRADLAERFRVQPLHAADLRVARDGTQKLLAHGGDGEVFEAVVFPTPQRVSCCISSQVGCPMGCRFCATGLGGYDRNLSAAEIVGQYLALQRLVDRRISHVVFMGMGEPLLNYGEVLRSIRLLHDEVGLSYRHITVSTVGIVPRIDDLAREGLPLHLALSLHSPFDDVRSSLMPVNQKWSVRESVDALRRYVAATGRKATVEYLLLDGITDTAEQARELARLVRGMPCVVNLIPFNHVDTEQGFARPRREAIRAFRGILESQGVNVTQRVERGHDIAAACGQLAGRHTGRLARRRSRSELPVLPS